MRKKVFRIITAPVSMNIILKGQLSFMNQFFDVVGVTRKDDKHYSEVSKRERVRMIPIDFTRMISPYKDLKVLIELYFILKREKPEIVHTQTPKAGLIGLLAAKIAGIKIRVHTVGGIPWMESKGIKRILLKMIEKFTYSLAHRVYPNSKGLESFILSEAICKPQKLKVLGNGGSNGINTDYFIRDLDQRILLREKYNIDDETTVLGFVGRIAKEKGINEWLDVFEELKLKYKLKILLIGLFEQTNGILGNDVRSKIESDPDILFLGRFDDVRPYYSMMDIFVFPSYREGFPNAVLEACSMELPIIATDINGCNEIIEDEVNGLLIEPKSRSSLKNALIKLIESHELRGNMAKEGRLKVVNLFKREILFNAIKDEYESFLVNKVNRDI
jgi:glycosyltransferase involved in cell wall biosynthesis